MTCGSLHGDVHCGTHLAHGPQHGVDRVLRERVHQTGVELPPPRLLTRVIAETPREAILALLKLGCGVGIVPELALEKSPLRGELRVLDVRPRLAPFRVAACIKRAASKAPLTGALWASICG
jgi:DNA-binding transcriptional LysR family regulator